MGDEVTFFSGLTYSPDNIVESGSTLVLRSSNVKNGEIVDADNVYVENEAVNSDNVQVGDVIVVVRNGSRNLIGKHAQIKKEMDDTVIGAFMTGVRSDAPYFINTLLDTEQFTREIYKNLGATINQITTGAFKKMQFVVPKNKTEQEQIGNFFKQIDDTIALHQRKLDKLKLLKQGYLQQLFPQNGEKIPQVRFANFEDKWEERKLGKIGKIQSGVGFPETEQGGTQGIPFYKVSDMNNLGNETAMKNSNNYVNTDQIIRKKWKPIETVPAIIFAKVGAAIMLNRKRLVEHSFLIDNNTMAYIFYDSWDTKFGKTVFETINLPRYAQVGALPSYNGFDIESIVIKIPNKSEQAKIGNFFKQLDNSAALHQEKLKQLKKIKKALLQKMFI